MTAPPETTDPREIDDALDELVAVVGDTHHLFEPPGCSPAEADDAHRRIRAARGAVKAALASPAREPAPTPDLAAEALGDALEEVMRRAALPIQSKVEGLPSSEAECAAAVTKCVRLAIDHVVEPLRRTLASGTDHSAGRK